MHKHHPVLSSTQLAIVQTLQIGLQGCLGACSFGWPVPDMAVAIPAFSFSAPVGGSMSADLWNRAPAAFAPYCCKGSLLRIGDCCCPG
mmetsp:Transcript_26419/g.61564  ORF Transcript_26419/g.61564 Transcript_26419/m.61564 type:complete len:88 (+) Transcript_26419:765-1028(+)